MESTVVIIISILLLVLVLIQLFWKLSPQSKRHEFAHNFAQAAYGTLGAVAIVVAGLLYITEKQWSARFKVDMKTRTTLAAKADSSAVIIQAIVALQNYGRTEQVIEDIRLGVDSFAGTNLTTNAHGDVRSNNILSVVRRRRDTLMPGEIELIPIEVSVPCTEHSVRVLVKITRPSSGEDKSLVYERKALVPLDSVCSGREALLETPFQTSGLELGG